MTKKVMGKRTWRFYDADGRMVKEATEDLVVSDEGISCIVYPISGETKMVPVTYGGPPILPSTDDSED